MTTEATLVETAQQTEQTAELDLDALIRELDAGMDRLPVEALRTCQQNRELVAPRLIGVLEEAARLAREGTARPGNAHFFAMFLVNEFQVQAALPVMLELYSLRDPLLEDVVSVVTGLPRRLLAVLAPDQPDLIESMVLNQQFDDYIRWEAAATFCQLVHDERMTRAEAIERLTRQLRIAVQRKDHWGVTISVCELGELNPLEMQDEIKATFDQQLVDEYVIDWECFPKFLLVPDQPGSCPQLAHWKPGAIADTVEELSSWYCFSEEARRVREAADQKPIKRGEQPLSYHSDDVEYDDGIELLDSLDHDEPEMVTVRHEAPRVGRNDPCPCGSGKKYKKCCLRAGTI